MLPKNFFSHIFKYLILSFVEKFGLALLIGGILISSWTGVEFISPIVDFGNSLFPFLFGFPEINGSFSLGTNYSLFHNISTISSIGLPIVGIFMFFGLLWDGIRYIFGITWSFKDWARSHKKWVLLVLFIVSLVGNFLAIFEDEYRISIIYYIGIAFLGIISFVYFMVVAIGPGLLIFLYTPLVYQIDIEVQKVGNQKIIGINSKNKNIRNSWIGFFDRFVPPELIRANMNRTQVEKMKQDIVSSKTTEKEKKFLRKILINDLKEEEK